MNSLLVTGGAGFIGSDFIEYELRTHPGLRVACFDKLTYAGNLMNLDGALGSPDFRFLRGDSRQVGDYLAGMTDTFAISTHNRLFDRTPDLR